MHKLAAMRAGGAKLRAVREAMVARVKPGVRLIELDNLADKLIRESGGEAAFKQVAGYKWATCLTVNEGVVHGIPDDYRVKSGDVVSVDVGMIYRGWYTDTSTTVIAGEAKSAQAVKFLAVGQKALAAAIKATRVGGRVGDISVAMERVVREGGYRPVKGFTGHGIGRRLHEFPPIPCFGEGGQRDETPVISSGMSLAIELIYVQGKEELVTEADGWTVRTKDGSLGGLFEETVIVMPTGPVVVTG